MSAKGVTIHVSAKGVLFHVSAKGVTIHVSAKLTQQQANVIIIKDIAVL